MEWIANLIGTDYNLWLTAAGIALIVEIAMLSIGWTFFIGLVFAVAALGAWMASCLGMGEVLQVMIASAIAVGLSMGKWRRRLAYRMRKGNQGFKMDENQYVTVTQVDPLKVKYQGANWDGVVIGGERVDVGEILVVLRVEGIRLICQKDR